MKNKLITITKALRLVFRNKRYVFLGVFFALLVYMLAVLTHKADFIGFTIKSDLFNIVTKFKLILGTFLSIETNFTSLFSFWSVIVLAIVAGINMGMLVYLLRRDATIRKEAGASFFGIIAGMFGIGCAACGSVLLTAIFGLGFTASLISFLPLDGVEFTVIALVVMVVSVYYISKKIINPMVCKPKRANEIIR